MTKSELRQYRSVERERREVAAKLERAATDELRATYAALSARLYAEQQRIEEAIDALPSVGRRLMRMRYIDGWGWRRIARTLYMSERNVYIMHAQMLQCMRGVSVQ